MNNKKDNNINRLGSIQINCEPNIEIILNDKIKVKSKGDGAFFKNVKIGENKLYFTGNGIIEKEIKVHVRDKETSIVNFKIIKPDIELNQYGDPPVPIEVNTDCKYGSLTITSIPYKCEIDFLGEIYIKNKLQLVILNIPEGNHMIQFTNEGSVLKDNVTIYHKKSRTIEADFTLNKIINISAINRPSALEFKNFGSTGRGSRRDSDGVTWYYESISYVLIYINGAKNNPLRFGFDKEILYSKEILGNIRIEYHHFSDSSPYDPPRNVHAKKIAEVSISNVMKGEKIELEYQFTRNNPIKHQINIINRIKDFIPE